MIGRESFTMDRATRSRGTMAFQHRNYRIFFGGQAVSLVGTWMQQVAQAWLVLELTGDPIWLGIVAAAQFIPVMILGLFAGVAADALPKRQTLVATQVVMMSLAVILAILTVTDLVEVWMILILAILLGCANAVDMPVRQSFAIELVGREDVGNAVALNSAMFNGSRIIGPALAGLTIAAFGVAAAFAINALSFLAVIVALLMLDETRLRTPPRIARPGSASAVMENLVEGLGYVRHTPLVLLAVLVVGGVATFGMNFSVLIPAFAADDLASGAAGYGFLMAASGVGSLVAALALAFRGKPHISRIASGRDHPGHRLGRHGGAQLLRVRRDPDGPHRLRWHLDGRHRQRHDPARGAGRPARSCDERLHHDLRELRPGRRPADGRDRLGLRAGGRDRHRWRPVGPRRGGRGPVAPNPAPHGERARHRMIVVAGEALIDLILQPDLRLTAVAGGGPFNTARTIGRLGGEVAFVGRLSTDRFGAMLREALEADGVDLTLAVSTDAPTTLAVAELDGVRCRDLSIPHRRDVGTGPGTR